jgi:hypothetical protein
MRDSGRRLHSTYLKLSWRLNAMKSSHLYKFKVTRHVLEMSLPPSSGLTTGISRNEPNFNNFYEEETTSSLS